MTQYPKRSCEMLGGTVNQISVFIQGLGRGKKMVKVVENIAIKVFLSI